MKFLSALKSIGKIFGLIILILTSYYSSAQQILIEGKIIASQNVEIEGLNIINLSTRTGVITDQNGHFQIPVSLNDSISISAVHIQETFAVIKEEQLESKKLLIDISEKENLLNVVRIRKPLSGYLSSDVKSIPIKEIFTATSVGLPNADLPPLPKSVRMLYTASSGPVDLLINTLNGERKRLKKRIELEKNSRLTENLLEKFPMTFFVDVLKIPQFKVYSFLFFCEDDPNYQERVTQTIEEIAHFLIMKSKLFLNKPEED